MSAQTATPPRISPRYSSLEGLPRTVVDPMGNLNVENSATGAGLRHRVDYLIGLPEGARKGTILGELLNWLRWGGQDSVKWECTLSELRLIIWQWERDNPDERRYVAYENMKCYASWDTLWGKHSEAVGRFTQYRCTVCKKIAADMGYCNHCKECRGITAWKEIVCYPRNNSGYNLILAGHDGNDVALAVQAVSNGSQHLGVPSKLLFPPRDR